jgi:hypothetical protein
MKKLLCLMALWGIIHAVQGQNLKGGLALAINGSQVDGDANSGFRKPGLSLGGYVRYPINDRLALRPEIRLEQLGSRSKTDLIVDIGYFSFPILLEWQLPLILGENERTLTLLGGLVPGVVIYGRDLGGDRTADLTRFDSRMQIGLGFPISERWAFDFRLGYSIFSFVKTGSPLARTFAQGFRNGAFHRYLSLNLYYQIGD